MENNQIEELLQQGIEFHKTNRFLEAEACYKEALGIAPNNADAIQLLGLLADSIGDKVLAVDLIKSAIAIDPTRPAFYDNLANVLRTQGENDLAIACYLEALKLDATRAETCFNLANLYRDLGQLQEAVAFYQQAIAITPDFAIAWINLAETLHKLGQLDESIHRFKKYLELKPDDMYCTTRLAEAYFEQGRKLEDNCQIDEAMKSFELALSLLPSHVGSRNKLDYLRNEATLSAQKDTQEPLDRKLVVIDIGCRWGFAEKFLKHANSFRLYGFDPDIEECKRLTAIYQDHPVELVPLGLASTPGVKKLYVTDEPACSSLLQPDPGLTEQYPSLFCAKHVGNMDVKTTVLDRWAKENAIGIVDYIKLDTQGTELDILHGGIKTLSNVRCLEIEVEFNPIYLGQPLFSDIDIFMRNHGFMLWKLANLCHYSRAEISANSIGEDIVCYDTTVVRHPTYRGQLYWAEAYYISKDVLQYRPTTDPQRKRDEILFDALGMYDVIHHISTLTPFSKN
jgi:FkbM family methyltransferase